MSQAKPDKYKRLSFWEWLILSATQFVSFGLANWSPTLAPDSIRLAFLFNFAYLPVIGAPESRRARLVGRAGFLGYIALLLWDAGNLYLYSGELIYLGRLALVAWPTLLLGWILTDSRISY